MELSFKECGIDDLLLLQDLSCRTFSETFSHNNTLENLKAYLNEAYNENKLRNEILNNSSIFYFLYVDFELAGYIKLNEFMAQTDIKDPQSIELERIYLLKDFHGKGLGSALMNKAIDIANMRRKSFLWLGVWEKNEKALRFYDRNGFYMIGKHSFFMGEDEQTDFILRKDIVLSA